MVDPRAGLVRGLRALVLAAVAVGLAGVAHTWVDGCVDGTGLVLALGACWPGAVAVLGRRQRLSALLAWTVLAQVATHVVVELTCGGAGHATPGRVLLTHGAAVLVTTGLLAHGDDGLWVAHALRRALALVRVPSTPALVVPALRQAPAPAPVVPRTTWVASTWVVRGPPSAPC